jgi:hypothetical protein
MLPPCPITCVLGGKVQVVEIMIGVNLLPPPVAGSRMVEGTLMEPVPFSNHGVPFAHVRLEFVELTPRASTTAPFAGR